MQKIVPTTDNLVHPLLLTIVILEILVFGTFNHPAVVSNGLRQLDVNLQDTMYLRGHHNLAVALRVWAANEEGNRHSCSLLDGICICLEGSWYLFDVSEGQKTNR